MKSKESIEEINFKNKTKLIDSDDDNLQSNLSDLIIKTLKEKNREPKKNITIYLPENVINNINDICDKYQISKSSLIEISINLIINLKI